jgi:hypothetical protein
LERKGTTLGLFISNSAIPVHLNANTVEVAATTNHVVVAKNTTDVSQEKYIAGESTVPPLEPSTSGIEALDNKSRKGSAVDQVEMCKTVGSLLQPPQGLDHQTTKAHHTPHLQQECIPSYSSTPAD